jgi:predicted DNA binding protein
MRISLLSKANESLPVTSRLSDGTKYLFLTSTIDQMIIHSLEKTDSLVKNRIQSYEMIQLMKNQSENIYESVLDACTMIVRFVDHSEVIHSSVTITSQVKFPIFSNWNCMLFFPISLVGGDFRDFRIKQGLRDYYLGDL